MKNLNHYLSLILLLSIAIPTYNASAQTGGFKDESALSNGTIIKISVANNGIFQIDHDFLTQHIGSSLNPNQITVWGNRGGMLPELNGAARVDDVEEIPLLFIGDGDNVFESGERFIFYAEGPSLRKHSVSSDRYVEAPNVYEDVNYYYIKVGVNRNKQIEIKNAGSDMPATLTTTYLDYQRYENDDINLLGDYVSTLGSGKRWFGDIFSNLRSQDLTDKFNFEHCIGGSDIGVRMEFAVRSERSSNVQLNFNGNVTTKGLGSISPTITEATYARVAKVEEEITAPAGSNLTNDDFQLVITTNGTGSVFEAWLDYIDLEIPKPLTWRGNTMYFTPKPDLAYEGFDISLESTLPMQVWDVTDPHNTYSIDPLLSTSDRFVFADSTFEMQHYIMLNQNASFNKPTFVESITNQNLHGITEADYVIVYHPDFEEAAMRLRAHREHHNGLLALAISTNEIFNEFAGGSSDVTAIRDFSRMLYRRSNNFKYLCLLGDGSYDYRDRMPDLPRTDFVPVYETDNSLHPIESFPSDDFFALLDEDEGDDLKGALEIAVGRIPSVTKLEADNIIDKIIRYEIEDDSYGDWMLRIGFVADDEDDNQHLNQSLRLADDLYEKYPIYNQEKIFFDAYEQVSTIGDDRYPDAKQAINDNVFKGVLIMNYFGHGGPKGWSQERVLERTDVNNWSNINKLPLFITATCSFTGYDDPAIRSGGELALVNPNGGAIALFTTVRAVYSTDNERLTKAIFERLFEVDSTGYLPLGEIMRLAKNSNRSDTIRTNARKFALIGDPAMQLALPEYSVKTDRINGIEVDEFFNDTIRALEQVVLEGSVTDNEENIITGFNGEVTVTVFDKKKLVKTLGQDARSYEKEFSIQNNLIYKGKAEVVDGKFNVQFVVPKDINYEYGFGRISYYAKNDLLLDAAGYYEGLTIGGTSEDVLADDQPPLIQLFMNNESFKNGGKTGPNPLLIVHLSDDNGINFTGNSIGHDITAILDGDTRNAYILNEYYEADPNDFASGIVQYPLSNLAPGKHTITVRAWDVANNMAEAELEFEVIGDDKVAFIHTFNYPNPFFDRTYFGFDHNLSGKSLEISVRIFNAQGEWIRTLETQRNAAASRISDIEWDGMSAKGGPLPAGIYFYDLQVSHTNDAGETISNYSPGGRVVLLR